MATTKTPKDTPKKRIKKSKPRKDYKRRSVVEPTDNLVIGDTPPAAGTPVVVAADPNNLPPDVLAKLYENVDYIKPSAKAQIEERIIADKLATAHIDKVEPDPLEQQAQMVTEITPPPPIKKDSKDKKIKENQNFGKDEPFKQPIEKQSTDKKNIPVLDLSEDKEEEIQENFSTYENEPVKRDYAIGKAVPVNYQDQQEGEIPSLSETQTAQPQPQPQPQQQQQQQSFNMPPPPISNIPEPEFQELNPDDLRARQQEEEQQTYSADPDSPSSGEDENYGNPAVQDLPQKEKLKAVRATVDLVLNNYALYKPKLFQLIGMPRRKIDKLAKSGQLDLSILLRNKEGMSESMGKIFKDIEYELRRQTEVTQEFKDTVRPLMVQIFMEHNIALTPMQLLLVMFGQDIATSTVNAIKLRSEVTDYIEVCKELVDIQKGKREPVPEVKRVQETEPAPQAEKSTKEKIKEKIDQKKDSPVVEDAIIISESNAPQNMELHNIPD